MSEASDIGGRLKAARAAIGLKQEDVATALGVPRTAVVSIEAGTRKITATELDRLATLYRRSLDWILGREARDDVAASALFRLAAGLSDADQERLLEFARALNSTQGKQSRANVGDRPEQR